MTGNVRRIYAAGNTAKGYVHFFDSVLKGLERIYLLAGPPGIGTSAFIRQFGEEMCQHGCDVEWIHSPFDTQSFDGVIFTAQKIGILNSENGQIPMKAIAPCIVEEIVSLTDTVDRTKLVRHKETVLRLFDDMASIHQRAYDTFAEALRIHEEWERVFIANIDFAKAEELTQELIGLALQGKSLPKTSRVRHMYLGAATHDGAVDHIPTLTARIPKRYFIKGRPGSGKSTMLKKIATAAEQRGFDVEVYHCGFDPGSLDMVLLPETGVAFFDSTKPHEYFPTRDTDEIVDMYARTITPGTDERYASQIAGIESRYSSRMKEAISCLAEGKRLRDQLREVYASAVDRSAADSVFQSIRQEITQTCMSG